ncbi:MAG TPA: hypothetical protein VKF63_13215, partial [Terracidiphilus sp.]|nr:hypothetical protein [Terracidiphilus sp.]
MKLMKELAIFTLGAIVGIGVAFTGYKLHKNHIDFAQKAQNLKSHMTIALNRAFSSSKVRAARVEHAVAPAPYFPPGSVWTQDISHAP